MQSIDQKDVRFSLHQAIPRWLDPILFLLFAFLLLLFLAGLLGYILLVYPWVMLTKFLKSKLFSGVFTHSSSSRSGLLGSLTTDKQCVVCGLQAVQILPDTQYKRNVAFCEQHKIQQKSI